MLNAWDDQVERYRWDVARGREELPELTNVTDAQLVGQIAIQYDNGTITQDQWQSLLDEIRKRATK